jgi:hypothetical protein
MITRRPVPIALKVRDLIDGERLSMECPSCRQRIGQQCYSVRLELPPDYLVTRYVTRHWCRDCSKGGEKVRAIGWIEDGPRSGAEGGSGPSKTPISSGSDPLA